MPRVSIEDLQPGTLITEVVMNRRGQILIPTNTELQEKHIKGLKIWGIDTVQIEMSELPEPDMGTPGKHLDPEEQARVGEYVARKFSLNRKHAEHPVIQALINLCEKRAYKHGTPDDANIFLSEDEQSKEAQKQKWEVLKTRKSRLTVDYLVHETRNIATLPDVYYKLMEVMRSQFNSATDMAKVISKDPGLTTRLLRIVNSAFYSFPSKIETVSRAITIIGTDQLCELTLATSVVQAFGDGLKDTIDMNMFWLHSVACATFARVLGLRRHDPNVERFFVVGLLHDIGRLILLSHSAATAQAIFEQAARERIPLYVVEKELLGFTHTEIGAELVKKWRLPASQYEAIAYHHWPQHASRYPLEAAIAHVSDVFTNALGIGHSGSVQAPTMVIEAWERLELPPSSLAGIVEEVEAQVAELVQIFFPGMKNNDR
ncbi:MAG: HDOD domain-containing protein [Deltaproteobacteria bacterium]|nr:HDOD domain-containing protein [Deltaproteobacteria bacterium]